MKKTTLTVLALTVAVTAVVSTGASAGRDSGRSADIERLLEDEARGGPQVKGGISPYQSRYRVCQDLRTPVYDYETGERVYVMKERCWWE